MVRKFGFSFSWKRALGVSGARGKLSRKLGIPMTSSGRQRKIGRMLTGGGCCVVLMAALGVLVVAGIAIRALAR